jgi:hypothetical protein
VPDAHVKSALAFRGGFAWVVLGYLALLGGVLGISVKRWRTMDLVPLAVMGLWLALALWHVRAVSDAVLLTAPFITAALPPA